MGSSLAVLLASAIAFAMLAGCSGDISSSAVRERDKQRREVAKRMPGNDVPQDPADEAR